MVLVALVHVLLTLLNAPTADISSTSDGLAASILIGSVFSTVALAFPVIVYVMADSPGRLIVSIWEDRSVLTWLAVCFLASLAPGTAYLAHGYRPHCR